MCKPEISVTKYAGGIIHVSAKGPSGRLYSRRWAAHATTSNVAAADLDAEAERQATELLMRDWNRFEAPE